MRWLDQRRRVRRCRALMARLHVPASTTLQELCRVVGLERGRKIVLAPMPLSAIGASGLWLSGRAVDYICYEESTSATHQRHIILHEIGHVLHQHNAPDRGFEDVFPGLSAQTLRLMLARQHDSYSSDHEIEAETFAYIAFDHIVNETPTPAGAEQEIVARLRSVFEI